MKRFILVLVGVLCASSVWSEKVLQEFSWSKLQADGRLTSGRVIPPDGAKEFESLEVSGREGHFFRDVTVLTVDNPGISRATYAIRGEVRYDNVSSGYLEMGNHFADGKYYYTRTLAVLGPMRGLQGSSDWRPFVLPFYLKDEPRRPIRLVVSVVASPGARVELSPLVLEEYDEGEDPLGMTPRWWWTARQAQLGGGIAGSVLGVLFAVLSWLAYRGRARRFVLTVMRVTVGIGILFLVLGVFAGLSSQPYGVAFPPSLTGILFTVIPLARLPAVRRQYEQQELRKMEALDAP